MVLEAGSELSGLNVYLVISILLDSLDDGSVGLTVVYESNTRHVYFDFLQM